MGPTPFKVQIDMGRQVVHAQVGCFEGEGEASGEPATVEGYASGLVEAQ